MCRKEGTHAKGKWHLSRRRKIVPCGCRLYCNPTRLDAWLSCALVGPMIAHPALGTPDHAGVAQFLAIVHAVLHHTLPGSEAITAMLTKELGGYVWVEPVHLADRFLLILAPAT